MIPFFRKIRKTLADDNKPIKYMRYAIGEIVLVVIGILIAVQLNNMNESVKQKLVEIDILDGIRKDILKDTVDINVNILGYTNSIKDDSIILNHLLNKKELNQRLAKYLYYCANFDLNIILHDSHFYEAKQKGLSIISNSSLRDEISRLYDFEYRHLSLVENSMVRHNHNEILRRELGQFINYDTTGFYISKVNYDKLLFNPNVTYNIKAGQLTKKHLLNVHKLKLEFVLKVLDDINKELKELKKK